MKKKQSALMKPVRVSDKLAKIVGKHELPRTEVTSKVWAYIKKHSLQDPKAKRFINPDETLAEVLGSKQRIDMFQMTKKLSNHIKAI